MRWDPEQYLQFAAERGRPFDDLVRRVGSADAAPGRRPGLRAGQPDPRPCADRWPDARIEGLDSSPEMIEQALAGGAEDGLSLRGGRPAGVGAGRAGGRRRLQRHPAVGARAPRSAPAAGRGGPARRLAGLPGAGQLRRPDAHRDGPGGDLPAVGRRVRRHRPGPPRGGAAVDVPADPRRARLHGRRVGDDLPARAARPGRRGPVGVRAPGCGRTCRCSSRTRNARSSSPTTGGRSPRRTRERSWGTVLPFRRIFAVAQRVGS